MKKSNIRPLKDNIFVQVLDETTSPGGIVIPGTAGEKPQRGIVKAVGTGKQENGTLISPEVIIGDKVLFAKYAGTEVKIEGEDMLVMKESDLMAIVD